MGKNKRTKRDKERRESGKPGGGEGRRDKAGGSGVYPRSAENIPGDAVIRTPQQWGQGARGAEGYEDSGGSELVWHEGQLLGGLTSDPSGRPTIDTHGGDRSKQHQADETGEEQSSEGGKRSGRTERGSPRRRRAAISRRTIKRDKKKTQLLERGEGPGAEEQIDSSVASPSEITTEGGPGTDSSYRLGGPVSQPGEPSNPRVRGTGGEGGYSTLGGGVYPDEGAYEDAPHYGDWQRHSSGTASAARGREGFSSPRDETRGGKGGD